MQYIKLNKNWNAGPNAPEPQISLVENTIELSFLLNPFAFEHIDENEKGKLEFRDVYAYRLVSINNEEYFHDEFRYGNDQLPWGEFYELLESNWDSDFPDDKIIVDESVDKTEIRHFLFFFRDSIFECLATDYKFSYDNNLDEILEEKYPKGYLNHYITMFASLFNKPTIYNFKSYTDIYIQMESEKEFLDLKNELKNIKKNNDLNLYLKYANRYEIEGFETKQLNDMIKVIEDFRV